MRVPSGVTDQYIYFVAVDSTDYATRETGLTGFTVYRSRNGAAASAMTTPTINETDSTNMPGVYELLLDEDMTIGSGNDSEEMVFHITATGMAPVTRTIELYRSKITAGNTLDVTATGAAGIDWGNVENQGTSVDLSSTSTNLVDTATAVTNQVTADVTAISGDTVAANNLEADYDGTGYNKSASTIGTCTTNTDMRGTDSAFLAASAPTNFGDLSITASTGLVDVNNKTGFSISGTITTLDGLNDIAATDIVSAGAITTLAGAVVNVDTVDTVTTLTGHTAQTGDNYARLGAPAGASVSADVAAVKTVVDNVETDTTDIQGRLPAALVSGRMNSNVAAIGDDATAATNLSASALGIVPGACEGTPTTTVIQTDLAETTDDHYIGRVIVFTSGAAAGEATDITDYTGSTGTVTVTALTTAPSATDNFVIV